ncbi:hypothetical protein HDF16_005499 [Granulicella aggregans]|uniref:Uncharacterized protein n=1 Tax=Granulicella aggregans TaxID=474949 RepID=A0A7W7ZJ95_9BACT|nr:hypothetical protein [Granulicella aggregans]MBB5060763.1 hypothetical protein [Granulicella aggregans]
MAPIPLDVLDYWRVNSYGYPNPFSGDVKSQEAWVTFESFYDRDGMSYSDLKGYWGSSSAPRRLDPHAVESWKATFEEFGLLYVISRSNAVTVTPGGHQIYQAAKALNREAFVWIGLNLLFRYPVQGPPRGGRRSVAHRSADVLPYRFLFSAMRDLGDYFWWTELERILCRVFSTSQAKRAVAAVGALRMDTSLLKTFELPVENRKGGFYNSLNQIANHAGLNHLVLRQDDTSEHYGPTESRRRHFIDRELLPLVSAALGDRTTLSDCAASALYVDRLPTAPTFTDEQAYFQYLGATVPTLAGVAAASAPQILDLAGDKVLLLKIGEHVERGEQAGNQVSVRGRLWVLCQVARGQRVILSTDTRWSYLVLTKDLINSDTVEVSLRKARPITNIRLIEELFGGEDA